MSYIHYDQKSNGTVYASVYRSYREEGKVKTKRVETLGRVIDKENGIFSSHGEVFCYTLENGRTDVPDYIQENSPSQDKIRMILDFGDAWFLKEYIAKLPFCQCIYDILHDDSDTVLSLILYRLLTNKQANCHARIWYSESYARIAFPKANLKSQNISRILKKLGQEHIQRSFFEKYLHSLYPENGSAGILIDSTGVPNATKMDITQLSNHNGDINCEARVIYVIDRNSGMPIYFRYVAGNILDVSTLITTIYELEQYGIKTEHTILDAGYFSEKNALELLDNKIPFLTRIAPNRSIFKNAVRDNANDLMSLRYAYYYGERLVFIKKIPAKLCGKDVFVYLCLDKDTQHVQFKKSIYASLEAKEDYIEKDNAFKRLGIFTLLSSVNIDEEKILPLYYTRQKVEQVFDITKNYADLLPIRVHSEETFAGHLLISFVATVIIHMLQQELLHNKASKAKFLNAESIFDYLRTQKCKVYTDCVIPQEACKEVNAIYNIFNVKVPHKIKHTTN